MDQEIKMQTKKIKEFVEIDMATLETVIECPTCRQREWFQPEVFYTELDNFCEEYGFNVNLKEDYKISKAVVVRHLMTKAGHSLVQKCHQE